ncbi:hypothetical protein ACK1L0_004378 [Salmonella enterica]
MTAEKKKQENSPLVDEVKKAKTCFIIMPIADNPNYEPGHFNRVYEYLIKPACAKAGYEPCRADDSKASHMIMIDILKKIMDCDMAICDLSSKNANVFYELGLRQAFNKKTILITDGRDKPPFDITGFRYVQYTPSLRVDNVKSEISQVAEMLYETEAAPEDDVNSIVKLLQIQPAKVEKIDLNREESLIYNMLNNLQKQISEFQRPSDYSSNFNYHSDINKNNPKTYKSIKHFKKDFSGLSFPFIQEYFPQLLHHLEFTYEGADIGKMTKMNTTGIYFNNNGESTEFDHDLSVLQYVEVK